MKNFVLLLGLAASVCCALASFVLVSTPLWVSFFFTVLSVVYIVYTAVFTKWELFSVGNVFMILPAVFTDSEDGSANFAWLKWGVSITEKE